jgi:hypothetical protein
LEFIIVGTGPVGAITALYLLKQGQQVKIIDIASNEIEFLEDFPKVNMGFLKSDYAGGIGAYDKNQVVMIDDVNVEREWFTSKASFGFSNVWGGTWDRFRSFDDDSQWQLAYDHVEKLISESETFINGEIASEILDANCNCMDKIENSSDKLKLKYKSKDIDLFRTRIIGSISSNIFYPWTSKKLIECCKTFEKFTIIENQVVTKIEAHQGKCRTITNSGQHFSDKVILAAGSVGTAPIILNSYDSIQSLTLQDTPLLHIPLLSLKPLRKRSTIGHKYSHFSMRVFDIEGSIGSYIQLYPHIDQYLSEITYGKNRMARFFFQILIKMFKRFLIIGLVYLKTSDWNEIVISKLEGGGFKSQIGRLNNFQIFDFKISIFPLLREIGLYPIWRFMKINQIGSSYHLGSVKEKDKFSSHGTLVANENIGIAGSLGLPNLEPGPITFTAMAHGLLLGNFMAKLPKL